MTLRILIYLECDKCRAPFELKLVAAKTLHDDLRDEVHELVVAAEADEWQCRKNATEHYCARCVEPF